MADLAITLSNSSASALAGNAQLRQSLGESVAKIISGNRLFNAAADRSAVSRAVQLQSQATGHRQAADNASRGASLLETAAAGLAQISTAIDTLKSLATQAASTSLLTAERAQLQKQFSDTLSSIDDIVANTSFGGASLLSGFSASFSIGQESGDTVSVSIASVTKTALFGGSPPTIDTTAHAASASTAATTAGNVVEGAIDYVAGVQEGFNAASASLAQAFAGNERARSNLADTDVEAEQATEASLALKLDSSTAVVAQASRLQPSLLSLIHSAAASPPAPAEKPAAKETTPEAAPTPVAAAAPADTTPTEKAA